MFSRLPRKHKILGAIAIVLCIGAQFFLSAREDIARELKQLEQGDVAAQVLAAQALGAMGSSASPAIPSLSKAVTVPEASLRAAAAAALMHISRADAVRALSQAMGHRDAAVRLDAAEALERLDTPEAASALGKYREKTEENYQRAAYSGYVDKIRKAYERESKEKFRRHKRIYGD